jgi:succinate-acetate transporter protein
MIDDVDAGLRAFSFSYRFMHTQTATRGANASFSPAFSSYGGFWLSYATIFIPSSGISAAYSEVPASEFSSAIGVYLMSWMVVTFLFLCVPSSFSPPTSIFLTPPAYGSIASLRKNIAFIALFFFLTLTFMMLGANAFTGNQHLATAGGGLGVVTALIAYYIGVSELLVSSDGIIALPLGNIKRD